MQAQNDELTRELRVSKAKISELEFEVQRLKQEHDSQQGMSE